jgi:FMN phosphatase YigB (HAD superfamily)
MGSHDHSVAGVGSTSVILTDLDNTIYNWVDFFAPSFRAMLHAVAAQVDLPEDQLTNEFREIFTRYGSVEYPYSIQKLRVCQGMAADNVSRLVHVGRVAFGKTKRKRLEPYPGVEETLLWAKRNDIPVIAVSNAPWYIAWRRIWSLGLKGLFAGIAAAPGFDTDDEDEFAEPARLRQTGFVPKLKWELSPESLKPSPLMYEMIMRDLHLQPTQMWVVGDSLMKDIRPALAVGASGVWARYGSAYDERNFSTLLGITHWSKGQTKEAYNDKEIVPTVTIDSFDELIRIVPARQPSLWG